VSTKGSDPANPVLKTNSQLGLTKREYFAGLMLQGMIAANSYSQNKKEEVSTLAVIYADALIEALNKKGSN